MILFPQNAIRNNNIIPAYKSGNVPKTQMPECILSLSLYIGGGGGGGGGTLGDSQPAGW